MNDEEPGEPGKLEKRLAQPMFALSVLFLIGSAAVIYLLRASGDEQWRWPPVQYAVSVLLLLWPIFLVEAVVRYRLAPATRRSWKSLAVCLAIGLLPPLRMAAHSRTRAKTIWLPWMGWREIDFDLQKTLERAFSGPMLLMALLILPVLAIEYFWADAVAEHALLKSGLAIAISLIWMAFATEFILRGSVADEKLGYALNHWVDVAVILLPMVEFMPFLRLLRITRIMRLGKLARIAKYYRLYGLAGKGWRGLVVLQMLHYLVDRSPEAKLSRLKGQLEDKREEIRELQREVDYYRRRIEATAQELTEKTEG